MIRSGFTFVVALVLAAPVAATRVQTPAPVDCAGAAACRAETEAAIAAGDFERAHDLAWRAAQQGTPNDPALMFLLARAQALSGRPRDAIVMLRRIAEMGVPVDASGDEFRRTRDLPAWPELAGVIAADAATPAGRPAVGSAEPAEPVEPVEPVEPAEPTEPAEPVEPAEPAEPVKPAEPAEPVEPAEPAEPVEVAAPISLEEAGRFSSREFAPGGLAYDAVSRRFVFGDQPGRKLRIVAEGGSRSIDLARAVSAGFHDVMALDIDTTRGDLWVASAEAEGGAATLHKLQLISGRVLTSFDVPADLAPVRPVDLAVTASGTVLVLDGAGARILVLRPRAAALQVLAALSVDAPLSLTAGSRDGTAYVAHRGGIIRVDLRNGAIAPLAAPAGTSLEGIERLRRHGAELIGVQPWAGGSRRVVRIALDAAGHVVTGVRAVDVPLPEGATTVAAVSGDTVAFLVGEAAGPADQRYTEWTFRRIRLR